MERPGLWYHTRMSEQKHEVVVDPAVTQVYEGHVVSQVLSFTPGEPYDGVWFSDWFSDRYVPSVPNISIRYDPNAIELIRKHPSRVFADNADGAKILRVTRCFLDFLTIDGSKAFNGAYEVIEKSLDRVHTALVRKVIDKTLSAEEAERLETQYKEAYSVDVRKKRNAKFTETSIRCPICIQHWKEDQATKRKRNLTKVD